MTPGFSTQVMGAVAVVYYVAMSFLSENLLSDSISAISLFIAFYYALTGFSCVWFFRSTLRDSARNLWFRGGILPFLGALSLTVAFFISAVQMWDPAYGDTQIFGIGGGAFVSGVLLLALGVVLAIVCRFAPSTKGYFTGERADVGGGPRRVGCAAGRRVSHLGCWNERFNDEHLRRPCPRFPARCGRAGPPRPGPRLHDATDPSEHRTLVRGRSLPARARPRSWASSVSWACIWKATAVPGGPPSSMALRQWNWRPAIRGGSARSSRCRAPLP